MRRISLPVLLVFTLLAACTPMQITTPPPILATDAPPGTIPTFPAVPTTVPTALAASPVIKAAEASLLESAIQGQVDPAGSLTWSADGQALAVRAFNRVTVYRLDPIIAQNVLEVPEPAVVMGVSLAGVSVAIGDGQNDMTVKSALTGEQSAAIHSDTGFIGGGISADGTRLVLASINEWRADVYNLPSGELAKQLTGFETAAPIYNVVFAPGGESLIWYARGTIQLMDIESGTLGPAMSHEDFIAAFDVSQDDTRVATSAGATIDGAFTPAIYFWDPASGEKLAALPLVDMPYSLSFSPDGGLLAADNGSGVTLWNTDTMSEVVTLSGHSGLVVSVAFSPDGRALASLSEDGTLIIWHIDPCNVCTLPTKAP